MVDDDNLKAYKQWIYKNGVPENREDIKTTNAIPLEYNLVYLNGGLHSKQASSSIGTYFYTNLNLFNFPKFHLIRAAI